MLQQKVSGFSCSISCGDFSVSSFRFDLSGVAFLSCQLLMAAFQSPQVHDEVCQVLFRDDLSATVHKNREHFVTLSNTDLPLSFRLKKRQYPAVNSLSYSMDMHIIFASASSH